LNPFVDGESRGGGRRNKKAAFDDNKVGFLTGNGSTNVKVAAPNDLSDEEDFYSRPQERKRAFILAARKVFLPS